VFFTSARAFGLGLFGKADEPVPDADAEAQFVTHRDAPTDELRLLMCIGVEQ